MPPPSDGTSVWLADHRNATTERNLCRPHPSIVKREAHVIKVLIKIGLLGGKKYA